MKAVLELSKSRFVNASSAIAFPMILAKDLGARNLLRLHSYAWNAGVRNEPAMDVGPSVVNLLEWSLVVTYSNLYFEHVNPVFGIIDQETFKQRSELHWGSSFQSFAFEAVICGACALGSLLANANGSSNEIKLVAHAKHILDTNSVMHRVSYEHVASWILRSLYLRLTTQPHASWMASATTLHICEAIGLHRELLTVHLASQSIANPALELRELELRRRVFWVAWALNHMLSYEYGRTPTYIQDITCKDPSGSFHEHTHQMVQLVRVLSKGLGDTENDPADTLTALSSFSDRHALITLFSASASFCIFRRLKVRGQNITKVQEQKIMTLGKAGVIAARTLVADGLYWWDTLGVPFQFVCILLAMNYSGSLEILAQAMQALRYSVECLQTHMAKEALKTAQSLVHAASEGKQRELELLCAELPQLGTVITNEQEIPPFGADDFNQQNLLTDWWDDAQVDVDTYVNELMSLPLQ